jgi:hypothetical protein
MRPSRAAHLAILAALVLAVNVSAEDGVIPIGGTVNDALFARITENGFSFIETAAVEIINGMDIPGMIMEQNPIFTDNTICDLEVNVTGISYGTITFEIAAAPFPGQPSMPQALYARMIIPSPAITLGMPYDCGIFGDGTLNGVASGSSIVGTLIFQVTYDQTPEGAKIGVAVRDVQVTLNDFSIDLDLPWYMEPLNWIIDTLENRIGEEINGIIQQMIEEELLPILEEFLQSIALSGSFPIEALGTAVVYNLEIQELVTNADGLDLAFRGSVYVEGESDCVDLGDEPGSRWTNNPAPDLSQTAPNDAPYQVGMLLSDDLLNQVAYSAYASGLLCQTLDDDILGGFFALDSLARLAPAFARARGGSAAADSAADDDTAEPPAPPKEGDAIFVLRPHAPPIIDVRGGTEILHLSLNDMEFGLYEWVSERWVRTLGIMLDADLGAGIELVDNVLNVVLAEPALDFEILYNEYSGMDDEQVDALLQAALAVAWPMLEEALTGIELPSFELPGGAVLGFDLVYAGPDGVGQDFLGAYLSFRLISRAAERPDSRIVLESRGGGSALAVSEMILDAAQSADAGLADALALAVRMDGVLAPGTRGPLAYSYRLDGGPWNRFSADPIARVARTTEGRHVFEARVASADGALDRTPARLEFVADGVAPRITGVSIDGDPRAGTRTGLTVESADWQSPRAKTTYSVRVDDGDWSAFVPEADLRTPRLAAGTHTLAVRAMDEAGNVSEAFAVAVDVAPRPAVFGCGVADGRVGGAGLAVLLAALLLVRPRRRGK